MNKEFIFTYDQYIQFLKFSLNYRKFSFFNSEEQQDIFILRHDIDVFLQPAVKIALLEKEIDISSTFFLLQTSPCYNPNTQNNHKMIMEIINLDHQIGLHFDPLVYQTIDINVLSQKLAQERDCLEQLIGRKVSCFSLHNPSVSGQMPQLDTDMINAYSINYFNNDSYLSDSCRNFRGKNPYDFVQKVKSKKAQLLFHPFHFSEHEVGYKKLFLNYTQRFLEDIDEVFRINSQYNRELPDGLSTNFMRCQ